MSREGRDAQNDDTYQLDVVVSLFAVMLVILVALAAAASVADTTIRIDYETAEPGEDRFVLASIQTPYEFAALWAADGEGLFEIDRGAVIAGLEGQSSEAPPGMSGPGADAWVDAYPDDPLGWRLRVNLYDRPAAAWLRGREIAWDDAEALAAWGAEEGGIVLFVWASAHEHLPALSRVLRQSMRPHRLHVFSDDVATLNIDYNRANFAYDKVLRPY